MLGKKLFFKILRTQATLLNMAPTITNNKIFTSHGARFVFRLFTSSDRNMYDFIRRDAISAQKMNTKLPRLALIKCIKN